MCVKSTSDSPTPGCFCPVRKLCKGKQLMGLPEFNNKATPQIPTPLRPVHNSVCCPLVVGEGGGACACADHGRR